jgi:hypothetical protein
MKKRTGMLQLFATWLFQALSFTACDDCPTREEDRVYGAFYDLAVEGQTLYPSQPDEYHGYVANEGDLGWECQRTMAESPSDIDGVCWDRMTIYIPPPYCQEGLSSNYCADANMYQFIIGPKRQGEVYQVQHTDYWYEPFPPLEPPSVYLRWEESGFGFPEYQSVSVTGTATVLSESPFQLEYDVVFLDEAGNRREVTVWFEPRISTYCDND